MATVSDVMNKVARECRLAPPGTWSTSTTTTTLELRDLLQEVIDELQERVDWPEPISKDVVISGDGSGSYDLPTDFKRLTRDQFAVYETTTTRRAGIPVTSNGDWTALLDWGAGDGNRYYRLSGDEDSGFAIDFYREPATGDSLTVSYVSKNWLSITGTPGFEWSDDAATLLFPRRLIELGVVWRYRRRKGLTYADRVAEYEIAISRLANDKRGIRKINTGGPTTRSPFDIPVPDFIPPA